MGNFGKRWATLGKKLGTFYSSIWSHCRHNAKELKNFFSQIQNSIKTDSKSLKHKNLNIIWFLQTLLSWMNLFNSPISISHPWKSLEIEHWVDISTKLSASYTDKNGAMAKLNNSHAYPFCKTTPGTTSYLDLAIAPFLSV